MIGNPKVKILMSTYNGEKYLHEQIDSVLNQSEVEISLLIRDDGSNDSTVALIKELGEGNPGIIDYYAGQNVGAKSSFFDLVQRATLSLEEYEYFAFCDQDDIWEKQKLIRAVNLIRNSNGEEPKMYCSSTKMVDSDLNPLGVWPSPPEKPLSLYNALVENVAVGCTIVMNRQALMLLAKYVPSNHNNVIMHDWWAFLIVTTFGDIVFDEEPSILYRQHDNNALGGQRDGWFNKWKKRVFRFLKGQNHFILSRQAREFLECVEYKLTSIDKESLELFVSSLEMNSIRRLRYAANMPFYRQSFVDNWVLKILFFLRKV